MTVKKAARHRAGPLALVGGGEWSEGCSFDADLLAASGGSEVVILPTAAAYQGASQSVEQAVGWFAGLGADARGLMVLGRPDAEADVNADAVRSARFIYIGSGSPLHLRSVLKESKLWEALIEAWRNGAVLAGSSAGAMVLGDPMVDPRGGAFTLGLGLVENVAVMPQAATWSHDRVHRTIKLAPPSASLVAIDERTALIRAPDGGWSVAGAGQVTVYRGGLDVGLDGLPS